MIDAALLTAEQFARRSDDFPDAHPWMELVAGRPVRLEPPDLAHGLIVLNLSKALARYAHESAEPDAGYACFELGLIVARDPDTVRCPAVSFFTGGPRFAELDNVLTETRPVLVVEVASTADRRRDAAARVESYLRWAVPMIWLADPVDKVVHVFQPDGPAKRFHPRQYLDGRPVLAGFRTLVADLFTDPNS